MRVFVSIVFFITSLVASVVSPTATIEAGGYVTDMVLVKNDLVVSTSAGTNEVNDYDTKKLK